MGEYSNCTLRAKLEILAFNFSSNRPLLFYYYYYPSLLPICTFENQLRVLHSAAKRKAPKRQNAKFGIGFLSTTMAGSSAQTLLVFFLALVALVCVNGVQMEEEEELEGGRHQREFDYFALSLQWPGTYCHRTRHCCSSNACCRG